MSAVVFLWVILFLTVLLTVQMSASFPYSGSRSDHDQTTNLFWPYPRALLLLKFCHYTNFIVSHRPFRVTNLVPFKHVLSSITGMTNFEPVTILFDYIKTDAAMFFVSAARIIWSRDTVATFGVGRNEAFEKP